MSPLIRMFSLLVAVSLVVSGCGAQLLPLGQEERTVSNVVVYEAILGQRLSDHIVADFVTNNHCLAVDQFLLCHAIGMAMWTDSNQVVATVYLYLDNANGFEPYKGELPFGLKFYDNMAAVEYKLDRQGLGNEGLPDKAATPDYMHYQATYHQAGFNHHLQLPIS